MCTPSDLVYFKIPLWVWRTNGKILRRTERDCCGTNILNLFVILFSVTRKFYKTSLSRVNLRFSARHTKLEGNKVYDPQPFWKKKRILVDINNVFDVFVFWMCYIDVKWTKLLLLCKMTGSLLNDRLSVSSLWKAYNWSWWIDCKEVTRLLVEITSNTRNCRKQ
jgi:hypothetical protein